MNNKLNVGTCHVAPEQRKIFSNNLYRQLHANHMQQKELAERTGLKESTISSYLSGNRYPRLEIVQALCDVLGCRVDELIGYEPRHSEGATVIQYLPPEEYQTLSSEDRQLVNMMIRELSRFHSN